MSRGFERIDFGTVYGDFIWFVDEDGLMQTEEVAAVESTAVGDPLVEKYLAAESSLHEENAVNAGPRRCIDLARRQGMSRLML